MATLLPSLSSDDEVETNNASNASDSEEEELDHSFEFGGILGEDGHYESSTPRTIADTFGSTTVPRLNIADIIAAKRKALKENQDRDDDDGSASEGNDDDGSSSGSVNNDDDDHSSSDDDDDDDSRSSDENDDEEHHNLEGDILKLRSETPQTDDNDSDGDDDEEAVKAAQYFETSDNSDQEDRIQSFTELPLCRPILRGVAECGYVTPTPIQANVIPKILQGRDICASAVTGSGKTGAFLLPILEIILHKSGGTKALILTPTRELANQCWIFFQKLGKFTNLTATCVVGGTKNTKQQSAELRNRPDLVICTPGRLLDHVLNTSGFTLSDLSVLCLDEADRLLDLGFCEEIHEILRHCPANRQTLLFSATMNTRVDDLIKLSLKNPVRVRIQTSDNNSNNNKDLKIAPRLEQEFVRIRSGNEGVNREAMVLSLLTRTYPENVIVFFDTKVVAHRLMILSGLMGIQATELHGNLTQQQRLDALEDFKSHKVQVLLATDLAARGLDIDGVRTVINFEMPSQIETYIHRIGRTARAGRQGCSCTLIGEGRRHLMKEIIKRNQTGVVRSRAIPQSVVSHFAGKILSLEESVEEILQAEAVARMDRIAEMEAIKAQNIIEHSDEIQARPQRGWFASSSQKQVTKEAAAEKRRQIEEKAGTGTHRMNRKKRRKREAMAALEDDDDNSDDEQQNPPRRPKGSMKSDARQQKRKEMELIKEKYSKSIQDEDVEEKHKKKKRASEASGNGSLFSEEKTQYAINSVKKDHVPKSAYKFRGFDPNKHVGKIKKRKGHRAFKSKSKFKRKK